jgi:hypothetical protein
VGREESRGGRRKWVTEKEVCHPVIFDDDLSPRCAVATPEVMVAVGSMPVPLLSSVEMPVLAFSSMSLPCQVNGG